MTTPIRLIRQAVRVPQMPWNDSDDTERLRYLRDQNAQLMEWYREYQEGLNRALNLPSFRVHRNGSNQTAIVTATPTKVQFNSIANTGSGTDGDDDWKYFDLTTNYRYQPKIAGKYVFGFQAAFTAWVANSVLTLQIRKTGSTVNQTVTDMATTTPPVGQCHSRLYMNGSTDYVEFFVTQATGGNKDLDGGAAVTVAWGAKVTD